MTERLAASGKVFLAGEYAVLSAGRPALSSSWKNLAMFSAEGFSTSKGGTSFKNS